MPQTYRPDTAAQVAELMAWAVAEATPLSLRGQDTKAALGRATNTSHVLDLSALTGIIDYAPNELVLTAQAGTSLTDVQAALDEAGQMLAFEPPDWRALLGRPNGPNDPPGTLGGLIACNLAGPRRLSAGAARDHLLGVHGVTGRAEAVKSGGRVVKNVTGFDLSKLMAGSFGTLMALTELSLRVVPRPETARTVLVLGTGEHAAMEVMSHGLRSPHEVSGAAFLPELVAADSEVAAVRECGRAVVALRIEGPEPSVAWRSEALRNELSGWGPTESLDGADSAALWTEVRDVRLLMTPPEAQIWRLSVAPMAGAAVVRTLEDHAPGALLGWYYDWGGGLVWLALAPTDHAHAAAVRQAIALHGGGHATLVRADPAVRAHVAVFQPQPSALAALSRRVKESFDPKGLLNPGRMGEGR
ncbi:glycolate oxidase subunit GlcE [Roseospira marina]|uniref:Glycolate oxidase subunit GlcE n=1 Tax=Roseospira marina TaxID=140057 RepID=A0A5M6IB38_9PROT|nr:glycolate oxidase subunit GlcE [Roseospira marina]KAA5604955.1 glycolate oxidase subunit GlcE [Roseospira marina]MBB4315047.1 glycolate oxidase FAD binding subunit [Roseospira marina]MBB5088047.1 glycolate oxidase FAD binding subunit [Roseospira marina]